MNLIQALKVFERLEYNSDGGARLLPDEKEYGAAVAALRLHVYPDGEPKERYSLKPIPQGTAFDVFDNGKKIGAIHQCMGNTAWSVKVEGRRWRLPKNDPRNLIHRRGIMDVTYMPTYEQALELVKTSIAKRGTVLDWPDV